MNVNKPGLKAIDVLNMQNKQRKQAMFPDQFPPQKFMRMDRLGPKPTGLDDCFIGADFARIEKRVLAQQVMPSRFKAEMFKGRVPSEKFRGWDTCGCNICQNEMRIVAERIGVQNLRIGREDRKGMQNNPFLGSWACGPGLLKQRAPVWAELPPAAPVVVKKDSPFSSGQAYSEWLEQRGYVSIGGGAFSNVYAHPKCKDRVIKVNLNMDTWPVFAVWAQYQPETFGIKMYSFKRHINTEPDTKSFYVAVLERIEEVADDSEQYDLKDAVDLCIGRYGDKIIGFITETDDDDIGEVATKARQRWLERKQPGLRAYCQKLKDNDLIDDLHARNWGFRPDGSLVIFDPSHDGGTAETKSVASETKRYKRAA